MRRMICSIAIAYLAGCASPPAFQPIFDGESLTGFRVVGPARWLVEGGAIEGYQDPSTPGGGLLVTENKWSDFELTLSFRVLPTNGRGGIVIREPYAGLGDPARDAHEIVIWDRADVHERTGSIAGLAPSLDPQHRQGWNDLRVQAYKDWIRVDLNGRKVTEVRGAREHAGHIALRSYGGRGHDLTRLYFRNLRVRPLYLPPDEMPQPGAPVHLTGTATENADVAPAMSTAPARTTPARRDRTLEERIEERVGDQMDVRMAALDAKLAAMFQTSARDVDGKLAQIDARITALQAALSAPEAEPTLEQRLGAAFDQKLDDAIAKAAADIDARLNTMQAALSAPEAEPTLEQRLVQALDQRLAPLLKRIEAIESAAKAPPAPIPGLEAMLDAKLETLRKGFSDMLKSLQPPPPQPPPKEPETRRF